MFSANDLREGSPALGPLGSVNGGGRSSVVHPRVIEESPDSVSSTPSLHEPSETPETIFTPMEESPESDDGGSRKGHPRPAAGLGLSLISPPLRTQMVQRANTAGGTPRMPNNAANQNYPQMQQSANVTPQLHAGGGGGTPSIRAAGGFHPFPVASGPASLMAESPSLRAGRGVSGFGPGANGSSSSSSSSSRASSVLRVIFSPRLRSHARFIGLFFVLTFVYSLLFLNYCNPGGPLSDSSHGHGQSDAAAELERHMKLAHTPIQQLTCRPCPECPMPPPPLTSAELMLAAAAAHREQMQPTCPPCPTPVPVPVPAPAAPAVSAETKADEPVSHALVQAEALLGENPIPIDSSGTLFRIQGRGAESRPGDEYVLCSFTRVCAQNDRLLFVHHDPEQVARWKTEWKEKCWKVPQWQQPAMCSCFHGNFAPDFLTPEQVEATKQDGSQAFRKEHYWSMHKWVSIHHIAHWAQKLLIWQSAYQHGGALPLPPLTGLLFHDSDGPLSEHEQTIFDAALGSLQPPSFHPVAEAAGGGAPQRLLWAEALRQRKAAMEAAWSAQDAQGQPRRTDHWNHLHCFERLSLVPHYGILSRHPQDTQRFRQQVHRRFAIGQQGAGAAGATTGAAGAGTPPGASLSAGAVAASLPSSAAVSAAAASSCPPRRALLLYRHNRGVLNRDAVRSLLQSEFGIELEYGTVSEESTSRAQVELFASTGLLLSSHSSQLINVLFSPLGGALIEIAPEFYNADFAEYAHAMGNFFGYALGGEVPGGADQPAQRECVDHLSHCYSASYCILRERHRCHNTQYPNKNRDFHANLTAVRIAVQAALQHLNWNCAGRW